MNGTFSTPLSPALKHSLLMSCILSASLGLSACGGSSSSSSSSSNANNTAPVADAGDDQSARPNVLVSLDASGSSDADGDTLAYKWTIISKPAASTAVLADNTSVTTSFTPDLTGDYTISMTVNDGKASSTDQVKIFVTAENGAPVANAGTAQTVTIGTAVTLDATASTDPDGDDLSYNWSYISAPDGSTAALNGNSSATPSFTPDLAGEYVFAVEVSDGTESTTAQVTITATEASANNAPVASAGADQTVNVGDSVNLDASGSSDADGDSLSYSWSISSKPTDSQATLSATDVATPSITPDIAGEYIIQVEVSDGTTSATDQLTLTATTNNADITDAKFSNRSASCNDYVGTYYANVTDIKRDTAFSGNVTLTSAGVDSDCTLQSNMIPNHDFNDASANFANNVSEQTASFNLPGNPQKASTTTSLALGQAQVIFLNGVVLDMLAAACYGVGNEPLGQEAIGCGQDQIDNPWRYDPMSPLNGFGKDIHNAHVQPGGKYHYHGNPNAMYEQDCSTATAASPVIGFAADGFPVYGNCIADGAGGFRPATPSYVLKDNGGPRVTVAPYTTPTADTGSIASNNYDGQFRGDWAYESGTGDLDECNGMEVDGQYGYYLTDAYPWGPNCFKGTADSTFGGAAARSALNLQNLAIQHSHRIPGVR